MVKLAIPPCTRGFYPLVPDLPAMIMRFLSYIIDGRYWVIKTWVLSLIAALSLSCVPAVFRDGLQWEDLNPPLPPAYELKSDHPLADTAQLMIPIDEGSRSHGAKLTPRVFSAACLFLAKKINLHPYLPASLGGCLLLLAGIIAGYRISGDRMVGLGASLILAGLYSTNACFSMNFEPKPFDGVAIGLVALTLILIDRPILFTGSAFLACFTDERAIMSLGLIGLTAIFLPNMEPKKRQNRCWMLMAAVLIYVIARRVLGMLCQWSSADLSMLGDNLLISTSYWQLASWSCFEGAWVLIVLAIWTSWKNHSPIISLLLVAAAIGSIASCLLVLDISRASCFAFPLIFAAMAALTRPSESEIPGASIRQLEADSRTSAKNSKSDNRQGKARKRAKPVATSQKTDPITDLDSKLAARPTSSLHGPVFQAAFVSLISTNWEIITATVMTPCPSTLIWFIQYVSN